MFAVYFCAPHDSEQFREGAHSLVNKQSNVRDHRDSLSNGTSFIKDDCSNLQIDTISEHATHNPTITLCLGPSIRLREIFLVANLSRNRDCFIFFLADLEDFWEKPLHLTKLYNRLICIELNLILKFSKIANKTLKCKT